MGHDMVHGTPRTSHFMTLRQAQDAYHVSRSTVLRAIKSNKLSAPKDENGHYRIDPAEMDRVFPIQGMTPVSETSRTTLETPDETAVLRAEIEGLRALAEERQRANDAKDRVIDDLRERLDREGEERRQITVRLLEHQKPAESEEPKPKGFWPFGRKN